MPYNHDMSTRFSDLSWRMKVFIVALPIFLFAILWSIASWRPQVVGVPATSVRKAGGTFNDGKPVAIAISPDNKILAISRTHLVHGNAWGYASNQIDLQSGFRWGKLSRTIYAPKKAVAQRYSSVFPSPFHGLHFSPNSRFVVGVSHDNIHVALINVRSGVTTIIFRYSNLPKSSVYTSKKYLFVGFSRDSNRVLVLERWRRKNNLKNAEGKALHKVVLLQISTASGQTISRVSIQLKAGQWPERAALINDNTFVCTTERDEGSNSTMDGTASVFDVKTGRNLRVLAFGHNETYSMAASTTGVAPI